MVSCEKLEPEQDTYRDRQTHRETGVTERITTLHDCACVRGKFNREIVKHSVGLTLSIELSMSRYSDDDVAAAVAGRCHDSGAKLRL